MSGGGRDTSVSAPSSDTFPWDIDTPTKQTATGVLQHLIETALEGDADPAAAQDPAALAAQDPMEDGWFVDVELEGADLLADDPSQHRVGKAPRAGEESPQTPVQEGKRRRTKSPAQLKKQAASQQERRKKMASALEEAQSEVTSLKGLLRDCQKALEISRVKAVEREARL